jgi:hypothetical protein
MKGLISYYLLDLFILAMPTARAIRFTSLPLRARSYLYRNSSDKKTLNHALIMRLNRFKPRLI